MIDPQPAPARIGAIRASKPVPLRNRQRRAKGFSVAISSLAVTGVALIGAAHLAQPAPVAAVVQRPSLAQLAASGAQDYSAVLVSGPEGQSPSVADERVVDQVQVTVVTPTPTPSPSPTSSSGSAVTSTAEASSEAETSGSSSGSSAAAAPSYDTSSGSVQSLAAQILAAAGFGDADYNCFAYIVERESSWNPYAQNPSSGAYGLMQALPGSKMASHGSDWASNPATQISWGLDYMVGRYGSPCGAYNFWVNNHWY